MGDFDSAMKEKLAAGHWVSARKDYSPTMGPQAPTVYLRRQGEAAQALTPAEARALSELLGRAADLSEGL